MAKKKTTIPQYGTVMRKGVQYYRTRILDADGKQVSLYATSCEELYKKQIEAKRQVEEKERDILASLFLCFSIFTLCRIPLRKCPIHSSYKLVRPVVFNLGVNVHRDFAAFMPCQTALAVYRYQNG